MDVVNRISPGRASAILLFLVAALYWPVVLNDWTNWDDPGYVLENDIVQNFPSADAIGILSPANPVLGNYHPVTIFSLGLDHWLWGNSAAGFHLTNLLLHLLNVWLVFIFIFRWSGQTIPALVAAIAFGIHPLHVEAVAWIPGRKDLLMTTFYLLGLISWLQYLRPSKAGKKYFALALLFFLLSLLSKAVAVTFPLALFLIDMLAERKISAKIIIEKIPFVWISLIIGVIAVLAQSDAQSIQGGETDDGPGNITAAAYGIFTYLVDFIIPHHLSAFHPYPSADFGALTILHLGSVILILGLALISLTKSRPLSIGIAFFLITLLPVSQLIRVGDAILAERYTYLPYVGIVIILSSGVSTWQKRHFASTTGKILAATFAIWLVFAGWMTIVRTGTWKNSEALWTDVMQKYPKAHIAWINRSAYYLEEGKPE